ncbi:MAG TPA: helix-turn-helix transcriptional regulator [Gillisia sp.]|nr:helix-turn-helix transcriptional regulator [Gillisia sp.]
MVNSDQFSKRLEKILEYYDISAAAFAEAIDVGRSSISHILSGRNKPSLDFVMKVVQTYPEVELYWLLNGKGSFPSTSVKTETNPTPGPSAPALATVVSPKNELEGRAKMVAQSSSSKKIRKIVFFYEDGSFEAFEN